MKRRDCIRLAKLASNGENAKLTEALRVIVSDGDACKVNSWSYHAKRLADWLGDGMADDAPFTIFAKGNSKLPFYAFSALPLVSCPGMGACAKFCYSLRAWRYPAAFFRQLQNLLLLHQSPATIADAFAKLPIAATLRLYVDGDIDSAETLGFWFKLLRERGDIQAYGYSKSWHVFLKFHADNGPASFPSNYRLNLSSGSRYGADVAKRMKTLPCVRGEFVAVPSAVKQLKDGSNWRQYAASVRASALATGHGRVFVCPGKCGTCTASGHACGLGSFTGKTIAIGIH
tara:strand:- start:74 stop:934 length:861 start_codon:yes stop_codon:yes gene_type:complete